MPEPRPEDLADAPFSPTEESESLGTGAHAAHSQDAAKLTTDFLPSFREPVAAQLSSAQRSPAAGDRIDDFELIQELGKGAFATVFLARQVSLGRQVALKVSANRGSEARTLASLEHDHIVQVFSEVIDPQRRLRLLCMQLVSGTTLERVIRALRLKPPAMWSGAAILEAIDSLSNQPAVFDPAALRDREELMACDFIEAVCWLGTRIAEALAHAHNQGVLHRDIKPANILLNQYGRPLLADFNVALAPQHVCGPAGEIFGGTLAYMAPEHLDAFNPTDATARSVVDRRSDIYSLGLVLFELLTGSLPFGGVPKTTRVGESLRLMASQRRERVPSPGQSHEVPEVLDRVVRRCLDPDPTKRYQDATELAAALKGCGDHRHIEKDLPPSAGLTRLTLRHPLLVGVLMMFAPHVLGSAVNISYNSLRIVGSLTSAQQEAFLQVAVGYNLVVYSLCLWIAYRLLRPLVRIWHQLSGPGIPDREEVAEARRRVLRLPMWAIAMSGAGWVPGGLLFPLGIDLLAGGVSAAVYEHFLVSFTISGLIALTYTLFAVQFLVLRVLYPRMWVDAQGVRQRARAELHGLDGRLWLFQLLAGLIPLAGALLLIFVGPAEFGTGFRVLIAALIGLGGFGFAASLAASNQLHEILTALTGGGRRARAASPESRIRPAPGSSPPDTA